MMFNFTSWGKAEHNRTLSITMTAAGTCDDISCSPRVIHYMSSLLWDTHVWHTVCLFIWLNGHIMLTTSIWQWKQAKGIHLPVFAPVCCCGWKGNKTNRSPSHPSLLYNPFWLRKKANEPSQTRFLKPVGILNSLPTRFPYRTNTVKGFALVCCPACTIHFGCVKRLLPRTHPPKLIAKTSRYFKSAHLIDL